MVIQKYLRNILKGIRIFHPNNCLSCKPETRHILTLSMHAGKKIFITSNVNETNEEKKMIYKILNAVP